MKHHLRLARRCTRRYFTTSPTKHTKSIFAARAGAKEGAWVAQNSPASLPPSVAVRLSPAVQLLEAENRLVNKSSTSSATIKSPAFAVPPSLTATATATSTSLLLQQQQQQQRRRVRRVQDEEARTTTTTTTTTRESMMESMRARQRERDRLGKPLFWLEPASRTTTTSGSGATASATMGDVARGVENASTRDRGGGRGQTWADSAGGGLIAFLALLSLPVVFGMGRRFESSRAQKRAQLEEIDSMFVQSMGGTALKGQKEADSAFETVVEMVDATEKHDAPVAIQATPLEEKQVGKGTGWFWSSSAIKDDESSS